MKNAQIRLAFRIVIGHESALLWDKYVFEDTYFEYKIQHQVFDDPKNPVKNYWELLQKNPNAERIPFLLAAAAQKYVEQLKGEIKSLPDALGSSYFGFEEFRVDLISSKTEEVARHKIGLTFYSPLLTLIDIIDGKYLVSTNPDILSGVETKMFAFHPQLSISYYKSL